MSNMNKLALEGYDITDAEIVEQYGLDPALIGDPKINDVVADIVYTKMIKNYTDQGMSEKDAKAKAGSDRSKAKTEAARLVSESKKKK